MSDTEKTKPKTSGTKIYMRIGTIMIFPAFISTLINMVVTMSYWQGQSCEEIKAHQLNYPFAFYGGMVGLFAFLFIFVAFISIWKWMPKFDKLDEMEDMYRKAKEEMEVARDKYTDLIKKQ